MSVPNTILTRRECHQNLIIAVNGTDRSGVKAVLNGRSMKTYLIAPDMASWCRLVLLAKYRVIDVSVIADDLGDKEVVAGRAAHSGETCFYTLQQDKCCVGDGPMQLCAMEGIHNKEKEEEDKY
ncbi:hypothetical protein B0H14DRAFT_2628680 [Mycena olivaceomarginata]|nr:hypothetical protein B0H14DRAFT_2628680 [Mycena olivaceomarginata]